MNKLLLVRSLKKLLKVTVYPKSRRNQNEFKLKFILKTHGVYYDLTKYDPLFIFKKLCVNFFVN